MEFVLALLVLGALVAVFVAGPLRRAGAGPRERRREERRAELEAAKEAKYREIRDAEMDFRMGKLSEPEFRATDDELRAQAIEILRRLDALDGSEREPLQGEPPVGEPAREGRGER